MKLKFFFSAIMTATLTAATFAATAPKFDDDITGVKIAAINRTLQVNLAKVTDATIDISIETTNGSVVHHETVTQMSILKKYDINVFEEKTEAVSLAKRYDLSKLPSGVYFVEVQADGETQYSTIVLD